MILILKGGDESPILVAQQHTRETRVPDNVSRLMKISHRHILGFHIEQSKGIPLPSTNLEHHKLFCCL